MQRSIFIFASILWHLQNVFSLCSYLTQISEGRKSLHLPSCVLQVLSSTWCRHWIPTPTGPHLTFTIFCLETRLCFMQDEAYCPSVLLLRAEIASATTIDFFCTPYRKRERECHHVSVNCPFPVVSLCMRTHTHTHVFCVHVSVCVLDHTWVHAYFHTICIC